MGKFGNMMKKMAPKKMPKAMPPKNMPAKGMGSITKRHNAIKDAMKD